MVVALIDFITMRTPFVILRRCLCERMQSPLNILIGEERPMVYMLLFSPYDIDEKFEWEYFESKIVSKPFAKITDRNSSEKYSQTDWIQSKYFSFPIRMNCIRFGDWQIWLICIWLLNVLARVNNSQSAPFFCLRGSGNSIGKVQLRIFIIAIVYLGLFCEIHKFSGGQ